LIQNRSDVPKKRASSSAPQTGDHEPRYARQSAAWTFCPPEPDNM
jgi:hypothetical protein